MFSFYHILWLILCALFITISMVMLKKYRPSLKQVLTVACIVSVCSELIKTMSMIQIVPSGDGTMFFPYLELQHLPLHLCSIQILMIFYCRFAKESSTKEAILAFMYPTCIAGAFLALMMPSIFNATIEVTQCFTHPIAYQYFLFHSMLIILGLWIPFSGDTEIRPKHYLSSLGILFGMGFLSLYLNSIFASPTYANGELVSVNYTPNLFFTYETPIGLDLTELWQWYLYFGIIIALVILLMTLFYLPFFKRKK
ncbi:MAG: YwaF family protein [Firmicutes bacterium]|nr:YwaF family protein [Bacillota bacterium]